MADENQAGNSAAPAAAAPQQMRMQVLSQYIRDMSFENIAVQKGVGGPDVQPEVQLAVSLDARKRTAANQYEVVTKYKLTSRNKANGESLFLLELEYGGNFLIEGIADEQLHPFLLIECPRILFPFVRRLIADLSREGGFAPVVIDTVDFLALYRQELARRAQVQQSAPSDKPN
jgi:preprotein translocase subunit SecB